MRSIYKRLCIWAAVVAGVLMIPLLANAPWTFIDFVGAGVVLFGSATLYEFLTHKVSNRYGRVMVGIVVAVLVIAIWAWAVA